jgi:hypothetical protein
MFKESTALKINPKRYGREGWRAEAYQSSKRAYREVDRRRAKAPSLGWK